MPKKRTKQTFSAWKVALLVITTLLGVFIVFARFDDFQGGVEAIRAANVPLLLVSVIFSITTFLAAAMVYKVISLRPLRYGRTLLIQIASSFTGRLLPAGSGGLATFGRYLAKEGHTATQATALASINNLIGFVGLVILTIVVAVLSDTPLSNSFHFSLPHWVLVVAAAGIACAVIALLTVSRMRLFLIKTLRSIRHDLRLIALAPTRLVLALGFSMLITISYAATLYFIIEALGAHASVLQTFIVLTTGVAAASITPTPGGIGGAEAGLVAALTSIGLAADISLSIALAYRFATFWLPIIPGYIAFQIALKRDII